MILWKTQLARYATEDGRWETLSRATPLGTEVLVEPTTMRIAEVWDGRSHRKVKLLCVKTDAGEWVPVEALHFTDDFLIKGEEL